MRMSRTYYYCDVREILQSLTHSLTESDRYKVESSRVWSYSKPDYPVLVIGLVAATVNGIVWPAIAVAFAEILVVLYDFDTSEIQYGARKWGIVFLGIGTCSFILNILQGFSFSIVGERLTTRLRVDVFRALMRQNIGWFDDPKNGVGSLTSTLSTDTSLIHYTTGTLAFEFEVNSLELQSSLEYSHTKVRHSEANSTQ